MYWFDNIWHIRSDLDQIVQIYLIKQVDKQSTWRDPVIYLAHALPLFAVFIDMTMNRIRIPWHHVVYNIVFVLIYLLVTYIYEINNEYEAIFPRSLNWACKSDWSYLSFPNNGTIPQRTISPLPCSKNNWLGSDRDCHFLYDYYCFE